MSEVQRELPFSETWQCAIVGHCIVNPRFFMKCYGKLQPQWFTKNPLLMNLFNELCKNYKSTGMFAESVDAFKGVSFFREQKPQQKIEYHNLIDACVYLTGDKGISVERLERDLTGFLRISLFKESIEGAAQRYRVQGFQEAYDWTKAKLQEIQEAKFEDDELVMSLENPDAWIVEQELRRGQAISTGNSDLDTALGGGLFKKEACAFMAPVNVGKTTAMITLARHAMWQGYKVLFLIHEGFPEEIRIRFLASFLAVSTETIYQWQKDPAMRPILMNAAEIVRRQLVYVPYIKTGAMFVEDVVTVIKKLQEKEKMKTGRGFDLIIDDYPKKLKSKFRMGSKEGLYRIEAAEIYDTFNHLATELDVHCFVAAQTNRQGLKQNNNKVESEFLLGMEEMDESFGIAQNLPNIITLNRGPHDKTHNIMRMNVTKSRNSQTDVVINTRTNYKCCLSFGDKNMFDPKSRGLPEWKNELEDGYLPAYFQNNNGRYDTAEIHKALNEMMGKQTETAPEEIGKYVPEITQVTK